MSVIIETTMGDFTIDLKTAERPRTCLNFLKLCKIKYYNFSLLHSIQRNFMIQTGDPTGTGRGGESIFGKLYGDQARYFEKECTPKLKHKSIGTVSMVNNGSDMHASQFFITTGEDLDSLDDDHTVFGEVSEGIDIIMKINDAICDEQHRPYKDIRISHTIVLDDPYDDPPGLEVPDRSPEPTSEILKSDRIGAHEDVDETEGKSMEEIEEEIKDKEAKARATILEMVGDLPEANVKPPENVLFVCKLNPVTTDEDLEIIFSRFGTIQSCEIIRDKKTGDSLQYAFIEFEKEEDCENAFFKMDNVLIDDRRIHVDFSQSVAMLKWKGKGKGVEDLRSRDQQKRAEFTLKPAATTQQGKYDMVFDEQEVAKSVPKKKKHKEKDRSQSRSPLRKTKEKERSRSRTPIRKAKERDRSRSRSPLRKTKEKDRSRSRSPLRKAKEKDRSRSRSPLRKAKEKDRSRSRSPLRKAKERDRSRSRSPLRKTKSKERRTSSSPEKRSYPRRSSSGSSPERNRKRRYSRTPEKYKSRRQSPSPERRKARQKSPSFDRRKAHYRSPSPDRYRNRQRQGRGRESYGQRNYKQQQSYNRYNKRQDYREERRYRR